MVRRWGPIDLDDDLRIRPATGDDVVDVAGVHAAAWGRDGPSPADLARAIDLLQRPHPTFEPGDMTVVEERATGRLLSVQHLSIHRWTYGGVGIDVGEIEHVSTVPDARRGGLVRAQTELMHRWASERGLVATVINGIPWLYTKFGYELSLEKWWGPSVSADELPVAPIPVNLRPANSPEDLDVVARAYAHGAAELLVAYERNAPHWRYENVRSDDNPWRRDLLVAEVDHEPIGFALAVPEDRFDEIRQVDALELLPGVEWRAHLPGLLDGLLRTTERAEPIEGLNLGWLGRGHPAERAHPDLLTLAPHTRRGAWYVRVPDPVGFLQAVAPALERRLADSNLSGAKGTLRIQQWDGTSVAIDYDRSEIHVRPWQPRDMFDGDLRVAGGLLAQIVLGYRSVEQLYESHVYRITATQAASEAVPVLFPTGRSHILPVY